MSLPVLPLAHGLGQREDLPLPETLFIFAAAVVLAVSFVALAVLWREPKLEGNTSWRPLPGPLAGVLGSRALGAACGAAGVLLLALTIAAGFAGSRNPSENFGSNLVFVWFWVGLVVASLLFGDVFRALNPWLALGRALRLRGRRRYPERLGHWPAVAALIGFGWLELSPGLNGNPRNAAVAVSVYTVLTLAAMWRYGATAWAERGEGFGVYLTLVSRISAGEVRDRRAGLRRPLAALTRFEPRPGSVWLVATLIGITTFDGFSSNSIWASAEPELARFLEDLGASFDAAATLSVTVGLAIAILAVAAFYSLGIAGAKTVGGGFTARELRGAFAHTLVPIAVVYVLAHYLTLLIFQGQAIVYLASDPLSRGWDLLGTADGAIDYGVISQNATWYAQVTCVVAGHVAALMLAHDRALTLYDDARLAVRSQYWMLFIMIGFTTLALWLLKSAGA